MPLPESQQASTPSREQRGRSSAESFIPKGRWQVASSCGICRKQFNYIRSRHHCRHCGISVCGKHSKNKAIVPSSLSRHTQRVCDNCFPECQRGITRRRRNTVRPRTISLRYETDSNVSSTTTSQRTDIESTTSSTRSDPVGRPKSVSAPVPERRRPPPPQPPQQASRTRKHDERSPRKAPPVYPTETSAIAGDKHQLKKPERQQQQKPLPFRRQAATTDTRPKPPRQYADSDSDSDSVSSLNDSNCSSSSDYSSSDDSDDEEMIARYLRRGVPLKSMGKSQLKSRQLEPKRMDSSLAAIKEKHSLETPTDFASTHRILLHAGQASGSARKPQNRQMSSVSSGTISVTDSEGDGEEDEDRKYHSDSVVSDCDEEEAPQVDEQLTPPQTRVASEKTPPKQELVSALPEEGEPEKESSTAPVVYHISEQDRRVMREIAELELEIQKCQSELPVLLDSLKRSERTAARLQEAAQESRERVRQYRKAHHVVDRSIRNAKALMKAQEYQAAILELLRASGIDRSSAVAWYLLAECRLQIGQLDDAEQACRKCIQLLQRSGNSGGVEVALLGRVLQDQGRHDDAIQCYLTALQR